MTRYLLPLWWIAPQTTTDELLFPWVGWMQASIHLSPCPRCTRVLPSQWYREILGITRCIRPRLGAPSHIHDDVSYALNSVLGVFSQMTSPGPFVFKRASTLDTQTRSIETHKISWAINWCKRHKFILKSNSTVCVLNTIKCHGKTVQWKLFHNFSASVDFKTLNI